MKMKQKNDIYKFPFFSDYFDIKLTSSTSAASHANDGEVGKISSPWL